jgi:hypothetical protein
MVIEVRRSARRPLGGFGYAGAIFPQKIARLML